jgi:hypothetical protein
VRSPGPAPHSLRGPVLLLLPRFFPAHGPSLSGSGGSGAEVHIRHPELPHRPAPQGRVGNKNSLKKSHPKKATQKKQNPKNTPKETHPLKMFFLGFFKC